MTLLQSATRTVLAAAPDQGLSQSDLDSFTGLITRGKGKVDRPLLEAMPRLQVIVRPGVGLDNVDVMAATERDIQVLNSPGINHHTVAEHALSLILMLVRNLVPTLEAVKKDHWSVRNGLQTDEIRGKKLGILGMGNIGQRLAEMATVMGMEVAYWDARNLDLPYPQLDRDSLLAHAEVISLHLPLTPETHQLINARVLETIRPGAVLINTARGELIDQTALLQALRSGKLGGFGADVLAQEPPLAGDPLLALPNVLVTPHSASLTARTYQEMCLSAVQNLIAVLRNEAIDPKCWANRPGH